MGNLEVSCRIPEKAVAASAGTARATFAIACAGARLTCETGEVDCRQLQWPAQGSEVCGTRSRVFKRANRSDVSGFVATSVLASEYRGGGFLRQNGSYQGATQCQDPY